MPRAIASGGTGGRPSANQPTIAAGTIRAPAVDIATTAARSGSPAVLSRTFHATWSTADPATSRKTRGSTARSYRWRGLSGAGRDRYLAEIPGAETLGVGPSTLARDPLPEVMRNRTHQDRRGFGHCEPVNLA